MGRAEIKVAKIRQKPVFAKLPHFFVENGVGTQRPGLRNSERLLPTNRFD